MRKLKLIIHTSLDGFVAGEKGEFDDLVQSPENLGFVCSLTDTADAVLAGRISFQMLDSYWPTAHQNPDASTSKIKYSNWYNYAEKIVFSKSLTKVSGSTVRILSNHIEDDLKRIKNEKGKAILMFGSPSVYKAIQGLNLIDEFWIIVYPIILGKGLPLFSNAESKKKLKLLSSKVLSQGEIAINYEIEK